MFLPLGPCFCLRLVRRYVRCYLPLKYNLWRRTDVTPQSPKDAYDNPEKIAASLAASFHSADCSAGSRATNKAFFTNTESSDQSRTNPGANTGHAARGGQLQGV